jgi:hypothetical protein
MWRHVPVILVLERRKWEKWEFEVSQGYIGRPSESWRERRKERDKERDGCVLVLHCYDEISESGNFIKKRGLLSS